jgi:Asp-tRNA(Asn)/Glu-tRNA(Gln) amidotransferase C subunit
MATQPPPYDTLQAKELTSDDVQRLAQLLRLPIDPEDLAEVTYRLGALIEELEKLTGLDLTREEPIPLFPAAEERREG